MRLRSIVCLFALTAMILMVVMPESVFASSVKPVVSIPSGWQHGIIYYTQYTMLLGRFEYPIANGYSYLWYPPTSSQGARYRWINYEEFWNSHNNRLYYGMALNP
jgi:hypothetical protein